MLQLVERWSHVPRRERGRLQNAVRSSRPPSFTGCRCFLTGGPILGYRLQRANGSCRQPKAPSSASSAPFRPQWRAPGPSRTFVTLGTEHRSPGGPASTGRLTAKLLAVHRYGAVPGPGGLLNGGLRRDWSMMLNSRCRWWRSSQRRCSPS